jgi:hypothetical protein
MKRISTLLASLILTISVFAAAKPKSTIMVQSQDRGNLRVVIDGRRFEPNHNSMRITGLENGQHQVKIYREKSNGMFSMLGKRYEVVFNNVISVKPRTDVNISIDRSGRATISQVRKNGKVVRFEKDSDFDFDRGRNTGDYDNDRGGNWGDYDENYGYERGMDDREFNQVLNSIEKEWLESNKLKSATQIATANRLTTAQVKELVLLFSFESNKLDLAKKAYANTVDKRNYSMINDAFSFNSSKDELARFIRNFR